MMFCLQNDWDWKPASQQHEALAITPPKTAAEIKSKQSATNEPIASMYGIFTATFTLKINHSCR